MNRADTIAAVLRRPPLKRPYVAHEGREHLVQGLGPRSTVAQWTATVPQLAEDIDTALTGMDAATAAAMAGSLPAGHALVIENRGPDLVGTCQCGRPLGRIRPGTRLDALAAPWIAHTTEALAAAAIHASA